MRRYSKTAAGRRPDHPQTRRRPERFSLPGHRSACLGSNPKMSHRWWSSLPPMRRAWSPVRPTMSLAATAPTTQPDARPRLLCSIVLGNAVVFTGRATLPVAGGFDPLLVEPALISKITADRPSGSRLSGYPDEAPAGRKFQTAQGIDDLMGRWPMKPIAPNADELH